MIDNYYCGAADGSSCPQSITISVNDRHVSLAYQNGDFRIPPLGIDTVLVIPKIHAKITFSGLIFSIALPYSEFGNNTWGQCGTCDNNRTDDCMLPSGKMDSSCSNMAHEWHTNGSNCKQPPPTPNTTPTPGTCNTSICEIIESRPVSLTFVTCTLITLAASAYKLTLKSVLWLEYASTGGVPPKDSVNTCPSPKVYQPVALGGAYLNMSTGKWKMDRGKCFFNNARPFFLTL
ncbi:hypothetical protein F7725_026929 [Dissostichus mawsoni]|uniref:VWFD domain-containing protein n=1 Tax=Dissostichus mawsoni TaxID=36200 RepID=A0A7J5X8E8_DISMA|nr:hypothetical protein F7725_026929 [Dissostichus mawsoni]